MISRGRRSDGTGRRRLLAIALAIAALAALPALALAHIERASYWPDPAPDTSVDPPAGGAIPAVRPLSTALDTSQPGDTRVVCEQPLPATQSGGGDGGGDTGGGGTTTTTPTTTATTSGQPPSRAEVDRLRTKLKSVRAAAKKAKGKKKKKKMKKLKRRARALATQLAQAQQAYNAAISSQQGTSLHAASPRADQETIDGNPSIQRLDASIADARANGYKLRASQPPIPLSQAQADEIRAENVALLEQCHYTEIQAAVNDSGNNDRVVIMPGVYTEPTSRAALTHDPACADMVEVNDHGTSGALSYKYQFNCPNDQNLIAVMGRGLTDVPPPQPPSLNRHGIPDAGPCIRCNLQIEGSGVSPDDVVVDGGDPALGDKGVPGPDPADYAKDVGIRADRADGFVLENLKVRHVNEHAIYVLETDGFNLDRFKTAYAKEYGVLTFVADHSLIQNCDAWGSGDAALYPGASADLGDAVDPDGSHPELRRFGTEIRNCDMHHSAAGYSGTDANAVWVHDNEFYDNTLGFTTDVFTAPGHPGFPQDSDLVENNNFHSNNFNLYLDPCGPGEKPGPYGPEQGCSDVVPTVPEPVGTGLWIAGGNHNVIRNNHFWDNWRRGTMLFSVPDQFVCGPAGVDPTLLAGCDPTKVPPSTSYNNKFYDNVMGQAPDGKKALNGTDFWWDSYPTNTGNCWFNNEGWDGSRGSLTATPPIAPAALAGTSTPPFLPEDCATSVGTSGAPQEAELLACLASFTFDVDACSWFSTPPKP